MAKKFDWNAPLYCNAYIAATIGAEAGIVYERLRWMVQDCKGKKTEFGMVHDDGRRWVDFTYAQLYEYLPIFRSVKALRDVMTKLEKAGLIVSKALPRAKWYTISDLDPTTLTKIVSPETDENRQLSCRNSSGYADENRHDGVTKIVSDGDENRHPPYNKESESTPKQQPEADTESFSSSDLPPVVTEEKEKLQSSMPSLESNISNLENEKLIRRFAQIVGKNSLVENTRTAILQAIETIRADGQAIETGDLDSYLEFYRLEKRTSYLPSIGFVVNGWPGYKDWLQKRLEEIIGDTLPGTTDYLQLSRGDWQYIHGLAGGDTFTCWDERGNETQYIKQPDGTFTRASKVISMDKQQSA